MKRLIAVALFAVVALPAAAAEHGGPWELVYEGPAPTESEKATDFNFVAPPQ
jgi:hypothetical protein